MPISNVSLLVNYMFSGGFILEQLCGTQTCLVRWKWKTQSNNICNRRKSFHMHLCVWKYRRRSLGRGFGVSREYNPPWDNRGGGCVWSIEILNVIYIHKVHFRWYSSLIIIRMSPSTWFDVIAIFFHLMSKRRHISFFACSEYILVAWNSYIVVTLRTTYIKRWIYRGICWTRDEYTRYSWVLLVSNYVISTTRGPMKLMFENDIISSNFIKWFLLQTHDDQ